MLMTDLTFFSFSSTGTTTKLAIMMLKAKVTKNPTNVAITATSTVALSNCRSIKRITQYSLIFIDKCLLPPQMHYAVEGGY